VYVSTECTDVVKGGCSWLGLTDGDFNLLWGVNCDIMSQGLIGLIEYSYHQDIPSFWEA
jgi:hypothetical protein